jgi:hypothetical protein
MSGDQGDQPKSFQDSFISKETLDSFQGPVKCHPTFMKTKYQLPVIQLIHKFLENIKETISAEGCIK